MEEKELQSGVSRRGFLQIAGVMAAGVALAEMTGCASSSSNKTAAPATNSKTAAATKETDVLVVGLGASGLLAAYGAAKNGAKVIAIDTAASMEGTTNVRTSGAWCVGSSLEMKYPDPLTVKEALDHINNGTNYQSNNKALRNIIEGTGRAVEVFIKAGLPFIEPFAKATKASPMMDRGGHVYGVAGADRAKIFQKIADDAGVECLYSTTAKSIILQDGKVVGVQCDSKGALTDIKAKAVIMCSGGFLGNPEMVAKHFGGAQIVPMGNLECKGVGINMAIEAGAQIGKCFSISMNEYGGANAKATPTYSFRPTSGTNDAMRLPVFGGLLVDSTGNRFINEGVMCEKTMFCAEPLVRDSFHYAVADSAFMNRLATEPVSNYFGDARMKGMFKDVVLTKILEQFETAVKEGWGFKANTLAELAEHYKLADLEKTVKKYNEYCAAGSDAGFFKDPKYLSPISTAPYYIIESQPAGWLSLGGIKCDGSCRAVNASNQVIPGLLVAGADADIYTSPYYQGGSANSFALASGLIAGETAAASIKK